MFTFSDDLHGRILQAYYNETGLVIRKSKLYEFTTEEKCTQNLNFFLQYLNCSLEGPTRIFDVNPTDPKIPKAIMAAKEFSASVEAATCTDPIASNSSNPSNDLIASKDFVTSYSPVATNATSDPDQGVLNFNVTNDLGSSNVPAETVALNQPIACEAADGSNASQSQSSSSTHNFSSDDASKSSDSRGTPDTSFSSEVSDLQASSNLPETSIPSKRKRPTEEVREVL